MKLRSDLQREHDRKLQEMKEASRRLQEDCDHQVQLQKYVHVARTWLFLLTIVLCLVSSILGWVALLTIVLCSGVMHVGVGGPVTHDPICSDAC